MYYNEENNTAFLVAPRTGSRTIVHVIKQFGYKHVNRFHHGINPAQARKCDRVYVSVRNHWDALVSWHSQNPDAGKGMSVGEWFRYIYKEYVLAGRSDGMARYIEPDRMFGRWLEYATDLIRFETLEDDLRNVIQEDFELPHIKDGRSCREGRHYSEFYSDEDARYVGDIFAHEIERLGYSYENVFSRT